MALVVDEMGSGELSVVVLPMFGCTRAMSAAAFEPALSETLVRRTYVDLPGHGDSAPHSPATSQGMLDAVSEWLTINVDGPALLAGASYGAYLAMGVARRRPELVSGLLLVCPGVRVGAANRRLPTEEPPPGEPGWLDAAPLELRRHLDLALGNRTAKVVANVLGALSDGGPGDEGYQNELQQGAGYALADEDDDAPFNRPALVVTGRQDRIVGYEDQFQMMRRFPGGTYAALDRAGHYLPFEQSGLLTALTMRWLEDVAL
jgi:pimeloyl-ACP methyl ester carboxylesterase